VAQSWQQDDEAATAVQENQLKCVPHFEFQIHTVAGSNFDDVLKLR